MNKRKLNDVTPEEWDATYNSQLQLQPVVFTKPVKDAGAINADVDYHHLFQRATKKTLH
jgi:hypothetical protein